jgi:hypothetical protein
MGIPSNRGCPRQNFRKFETIEGRHGDVGEYQRNVDLQQDLKCLISGRGLDQIRAEL